MGTMLAYQVASIIGSNLLRRGTHASSSLRGCMPGKVETAVARVIAAALHINWLLPCRYSPCSRCHVVLQNTLCEPPTWLHWTTGHLCFCIPDFCIHIDACMGVPTNVWFPIWTGPFETQGNICILLGLPTLSLPILRAWTTPLLLLQGSINHIYSPGATQEEGALFPSKANPLLFSPSIVYF